jgi:hypothetical protein
LLPESVAENRFACCCNRRSVVLRTNGAFNYCAQSRDHSVADGLAFNAVWSAAMLQVLPCVRAVSLIAALTPELMQTADLTASAASKTPEYAPLLKNLQ